MSEIVFDVDGVTVLPERRPGKLYRSIRRAQDGSPQVVELSDAKQAEREAEVAKAVAEKAALEGNYRNQRKAAYISELGEKPDFTEAVGDVLDDLIREVRALAVEPKTPEFATLGAKIDAIKARFPK